jgi:hypothetical protein
MSFWLLQVKFIFSLYKVQTKFYRFSRKKNKVYKYLGLKYNLSLVVIDSDFPVPVGGGSSVWVATERILVRRSEVYISLCS